MGIVGTFAFTSLFPILSKTALLKWFSYLGLSWMLRGAHTTKHLVDQSRWRQMFEWQTYGEAGKLTAFHLSSQHLSSRATLIMGKVEKQCGED